MKVPKNFFKVLSQVVIRRFHRGTKRKIFYWLELLSTDIKLEIKVFIRRPGVRKYKKRRLTRFLILLIAVNLNMLGFIFPSNKAELSSRKSWLVQGLSLIQASQIVQGPRPAQGNQAFDGSRAAAPSNSNSHIKEAGTVQEPGLVVLTYHNILPEKSSFVDKSGTSVSPERLDQDIRFLKSNGFNFVTMEEVSGYLLRGQPLPRRSVILAFDDGYESNYIWAYPLLKKYGAKAAIFVVAGNIEQVSQTYDMNKNQKISWPQLREMYQSGLVSIQAHSYNLHYIRYDGIYAVQAMKGESAGRYEKRIYNDLLRAKKIIWQRTGSRVMALSWPYGKYTPTAIKMANKAGYALLWTTEFGTVKSGDNPLYLNRITMNKSIELEMAAAGYRIETGKGRD